MAELDWEFWFPLALLLGILVYLLPAIVAFARNRPNKGTIAWVNILSGVTLVGWLVALGWALRGKSEAPLSGMSKLLVVTAAFAAGFGLMMSYPSMDEHRRKGSRAEGKSALLRSAMLQGRVFGRQQERVWMGHSLRQPPASPEGAKSIRRRSEKGYGFYTISVVLASDRKSFVLIATPNPPFADSKCGSLTLTSEGVRHWTGAPANAGECRW